MARVEQERLGKGKGAPPLFKVTSEKPPMNTMVDLTIEYLERARELMTYYMGEPEITVQIPHNEPIRILVLGDLHLGSASVDYQAIRKIKEDVLTHPNVGVIFLGDVIEGIKSQFLRTNVMSAPVPFSNQITLARQWLLEPLAEQGKVLAMVSDHFAHEGWADQAMTISPWLEMVRGLGIRMVRNGGLVTIIFKNGHQETFQLYHLTKRKSTLDPLHGLTTVAHQYSSENRPDAILGGHIHRVAAGREKDNEGPTCLVQAGTWKGTRPESADPLGIAAGMTLADPGGQGVVIQTRRRGQPHRGPVPTYSAEEGKIVHAALDLLNKAEQHQLTGELTERLKATQEGGAKITFRRRRSRRAKVPHKETREQKLFKPENGYAPQYQELSYEIATALPLALVFIAGTRFGTNSIDVKQLKTVIEHLQNNPYGAALTLGGIIDRQAVKDPKRLQILNEAIRFFSPIRGKNLGLLLDTVLRHDGWKKKVGKSADGAPIPAGTYLSQKLTLPLIINQAVISLSVRKPTSKSPAIYTIVTLDHLGHRGSTAKATAGLRSVYRDLLPKKPGMVVGGHMPLAGETTIYDRFNPETDWPHFIAPGWLAHTALWGSKANEIPGGKGGLGVILLPDKYLAIPTASLEETQYLHQALMLLGGLKILGLDPKNL